MSQTTTSSVEPLRIVHTESSCGWGGQEIRILTESAGMIKRGHSVIILCPKESKLYQEATRRHIPVEALPIAKKSAFSLLALKKWIQAHQHKIDVINTHSSTDTWLTALSLKWLGSRLPLVRTRHISAPIAVNFASKWLYLTATNFIVTTGKALREQVIETFESAAPDLHKHIHSVPTGIDTSVFRPGNKILAREQLGIDPENFVIGIVATLRSWKGHSFLVDAFHKIKHQYPNVNLLIVGDGPQREALSKQIESLGLKGQVIMPGNQRDVVPWLNAMDLFVLPSYANEGVPQALLQAMLCELPVITTDIGAIPEVAWPNRTALVVAPSSSQELEEAIIQIMTHRDLAQKLAHQAREEVLRHHSLENMLNKMEEVFLHVLKR